MIPFPSFKKKLEMGAFASYDIFSNDTFTFSHTFAHSVTTRKILLPLKKISLLSVNATFPPNNKTYTVYHVNHYKMSFRQII